MILLKFKHSINHSIHQFKTNHFFFIHIIVAVAVVVAVNLQNKIYEGYYHT